MKKKKIYISGRVMGLPFEMVRAVFENYENMIREAGFEPVNPVKEIEAHNFNLKRLGKVPLNDSDNRAEILGLCIRDLSLCDAILLIPGSSFSVGANLEKTFSLSTSIKVLDMANFRVGDTRFYHAKEVSEISHPVNWEFRESHRKRFNQVIEGYKNGTL